MSDSNSFRAWFRIQASYRAARPRATGRRPTSPGRRPADPGATTPGPHESGKRVIVGHSSQKTGEILDLGHLKCSDTFCYGGGWLTALEVATDEVEQANREGSIRR